MRELEIMYCEEANDEYVEIIYKRYRGHSKDKRNRLFTTLESWRKVLLMKYYNASSLDDIL